MNEHIRHAKHSKLSPGELRESLIEFSDRVPQEFSNRGYLWSSQLSNFSNRELLVDAIRINVMNGEISEDYAGFLQLEAYEILKDPNYN